MSDYFMLILKMIKSPLRPGMKKVGGEKKQFTTYSSWFIQEHTTQLVCFEADIYRINVHIFKSF